MKKTLLYTIALLFISVSVFAQNPSKLMREGMLEYKKGNFPNSIAKYNEAIKKGADKNLANYNIGAAYYKADKADSALMHWQSVATTDDNKELLARSWHNIGNSLVKQGSLDKAVDAYKNALKLNPNDEDTRYNLAYSQRRLQQQQQQQQKQDDKKKDEKEKDQPKPEEKPDPKEDLNKDEAEKILKAMDNKEKDLHKGKKGEGDPRTPTKDW
jgi:Ca-activated chloride channel family protein